MDNRSEKIDRYFRDRLTDFKQSPPDAAWDTIANKLGHKKKKGIVPILFRIAAGMAILLSTGIGYYLLTGPADKAASSELTIQKLDTTNDDVRSLSEPHRNSPVSRTEKKYVPATHADRTVGNDEGAALADATVISETARSESAGMIISNDTAKTKENETQLLTITLAKTPDRNTLIPITLPSGLDHNSPVPARTVTPEEATALLLADLEENDNEKADKDQWTLGSEVAPLYSYRSISSETNKSDMISDLNESESGILAYAGGIRLAFSTSKRFSVQSGIYYSRYGQEKNNVEAGSSKYIESNSDGIRNSKYLEVTNSTGVISGEFTDNTGNEVAINDNSGASAEYIGQNTNTYMFINTDKATVAPFEETDITMTQYFDYFELPLLVKYKLIDRKIDFSFSGGIVTNFLFGNKVDMKLDGETTQVSETTDINLVNCLGSIGMGVEYPIVSGFALTLEPRFRYYLNPIYKNSQYDVHPYSFGIFAGISYVF